MFDIGFWELLLIGIVALVVVGPERLPEVAKSAGVYVAKFRRFVAGVKSDIDAELETGELKKILGDQRDQIRELKDIVDTTRKEIETSTSSAVSSANELSSSMENKYREMGTTTADKTATTGESDASLADSSKTDLSKTDSSGAGETRVDADDTDTGDKPASSA